MKNVELKNRFIDTKTGIEYALIILIHIGVPS